MNIKNNYHRFIFSLILLTGISSNILAETVVRDHRVLKKVAPRAAVRDHRTGKVSNTVVRDHRLQAPVTGVIAPVAPKSDVTIAAILSDSCRCDLRDVQAVSGKGLKVVIKNIGQGTAKNIKVTVSYYRLVDRSRKLFTQTRVMDLRRHETRTVYMTPAAYLTSTSTEFIATVEASNDSNLSNNRYTSFGCHRNYIE